MNGPPRSGGGSGWSLLVIVYVFFAVAASGRAITQLATKLDEAPLAYALSALAAFVYVVAAVSLFRGSERSLRLARAALAFELVGVLAIGSASLVDRDAFPDETVWSTFGLGYGFVPLVLPALGLWWLSRRPAAATPPAEPTRP